MDFFSFQAQEPIDFEESAPPNMTLYMEANGITIHDS